jgi:hypothetical protein
LHFASLLVSQVPATPVVLFQLVRNLSSVYFFVSHLIVEYFCLNLDSWEI